MTRLSRRTMLRGMGASVALPWLEAMAAPRVTASGAPKRLVCLFQPNGVYPKAWDVTGTGADYRLSKILEPLAPHKSELLVVSQLSSGAKGHVGATSAFLTGTPITKDANAPAFRPNMGVSLDQFVAQRLGKQTRLASLEVGTEPPRAGGENDLPIAFASSVSWSGPQTKVDPEILPQAVFDRLFGDKAASRKRLEDNKSLLDRVAEDARRLEARLGASDRRKLDEYLTSVRDVEKRIEDSLMPRASSWTPKSKPVIERPGDGIPARRDEYVRIMMDLLIAALQTDSTRVATFMLAHGFSRQNFTFLDGVKGDHHSISHHKEEADMTTMYTAVTRWYISQLAYLLDRMKGIDEGGASLLDNSIVLYGSGLKDGNAHTTSNLPILLAGRGQGTLNPGRHVALAKNTPLANLHLSIAQRMGIEADKFTTSTGAIAEL